MASPPKCKICGVAEWRHICGAAAKKLPGSSTVEQRPVKAKVVGSNPSRAAKPIPRPQDKRAVTKGAAAVEREPPSGGSAAPTKPKRDPEKWREYMREFMRKKRAADKADKR
jgi:hypothetical protein